MSIIFSHPTGNANVRAAVQGLHQSGNLYGFNTSIATFPGSIIYKLGAYRPLSEIRRRSYDSSLRDLTHKYPWIELGRLISSKAGLSSLIRHEKGIFSVDKVYRSIDQQVALKLQAADSGKIKGVYAYEDGALITFLKAKKSNLQCLYDLPIGYWKAARKLLEVEKSNNPDWASTLTGFKDSANKLARKDRELSLADHIFVASTFTKNTLSEYGDPLAPISVIPYGFPAVTGERDYRKLGRQTLKVLFVGGLSQRKGLAQLFEAVAPFCKELELTIIGQKTGADCPALDRALAKHHWIPSLPHAAILKQMREHDVLLFPSLFEGFGLVITEAMSQGTPVITTERTAGPDFIRHGENGWLVPAGSSNAIRDILSELLELPQKVSSAGNAAMETARARPWDIYGQELASAVIQLIK